MKTVTGIAVVFSLLFGAHGQDFGRSKTLLLPKFEGESLPVPPAQAEAWEPPEIPEFEAFVAASAQLFADGLADPRGCEYREITIVAGTCWGRAGEVATHGWVLPGQPEFAVSWNGLVYPVTAMGELAELEADVAELLQNCREQPEKGNSMWLDHEFSGENEADSVSAVTKFPVKACLLLRLGHSELAEAYLGLVHQPEGQPVYELLAEDWIWSLTNRAICAHMREDDRLVRASAEFLAGRADKIREKIAALPAKDGKPRKREPLAFLASMSAIGEDNARRIEAAKADVGGGKKNYSDWTVEELIADMDNVWAPQLGQPGGVSLGYDPRVRALIAHGNAAVEPLIVCFERDRRPTRSVKFFRDYTRFRTVIGVHEAAYVCLINILDHSFLKVRSTGHSMTALDENRLSSIAEDIRQYWEHNKHLSREERWFRDLADDDAGKDRWVEMAANITRPAGKEVVKGSQFLSGAQASRRAEPNQPAGENLRSKSDPGVTDLIIRRMRELTFDPKSRGHAVALARALVRWDPRRREELDRVAEKLETDFRAEPKDSKSVALREIVSLAEARIAGGDHGAITWYVRAMSRAGKRQIGDDWQLLRLMAKHFDDPAVASAAESLFGNGGIWGPLERWDPPVRFWPVLVANASFRGRLRDLLDDREYTGTVEIGEESYTVRSKRSSSRFEFAPGATSRPESDTKIYVRECDLTAHALARRRVAGVTFEIFRPEAERDRQIEKLREKLAP